MVTYRIRKMIAWGMAVTMTAGMTNVLTGPGSGKEKDRLWRHLRWRTPHRVMRIHSMEKICREPVTLDWYVNYSWFAIPWERMQSLKRFTEETGVKSNFITPIGNETEKLNALIDWILCLI